HFVEGGDIDKALSYSIRAGEAAAAVFAYEEAAAHWETALELMPDVSGDRERRADLLERTAEVLGLSAAPGAQFKYLERALKFTGSWAAMRPRCECKPGWRSVSWEKTYGSSRGQAPRGRRWR